jgi:hypothetical protein
MDVLAEFFFFLMLLLSEFSVSCKLQALGHYDDFYFVFNFVDRNAVKSVNPQSIFFQLKRLPYAAFASVQFILLFLLRATIQAP